MLQTEEEHLYLALSAGIHHFVSEHVALPYYLFIYLFIGYFIFVPCCFFLSHYGMVILPDLVFRYAFTLTPGNTFQGP